MTEKPLEALVAEIERVLGIMRELDEGTSYPPLRTRLQKAGQDLGEARATLHDDRFQAWDRIRTAFRYINHAKARIAEGVALKEERDIRRSWGEQA